MLDFGFATADEIGKELGLRLKTVRLSQGLKQLDLAQRAGVSRGTVNTLENHGQCTLSSLLRLVQALSLEGELQGLFLPKARSIAELERNEQGQRQRAPRMPPKGAPK